MPFLKRYYAILLLLLVWAMHLPFITADPDPEFDVHTRGAWTDEGLYPVQSRNFVNHGVLNLEENETIMRYNFSEDICDWDEIFIVNVPSDDFTIQKHDVLKIHLKEDRYIYHDFGSWDSLNIYVNRVFKYIDGDSTNNGYNVAPWTKEHKTRASSLAEEINLPDFCTLSVFNKQTGSYKAYLKLPGSPTAGHSDLDPEIRNGDVFFIKITNGYVLNYDTTLIDDEYYTLAQNNCD